MNKIDEQIFLPSFLFFFSCVNFTVKSSHTMRKEGRKALFVHVIDCLFFDEMKEKKTEERKGEPSDEKKKG